ncbi:MAG: ATP-dependent zinc protease [Gammaproteobacteria bacterium]|nr:ATP-dependent zinc protease [Gammaproteobacteria bacterium]
MPRRATKTCRPELNAHSIALARVETVLVGLPELIKSTCPPAAPPAQHECAKPVTTRVPVSSDKLVVGIREHVRVDPFDADLVARIDAGTAANSLYVTDIVEFQRDGNNWVRFSLTPPKAQAATEVERQIARRKSGDVESKDITVRLRTTLADVTETYEFVLVTRKASDYQVRLGRTFLKDMALVDVSKRFVQSRPSVESP